MNNIIEKINITYSYIYSFNNWYKYFYEYERNKI